MTENVSRSDKTFEPAPDGMEWVFTPYITVKGKTIYHPTGGVFRFLGRAGFQR